MMTLKFNLYRHKRNRYLKRQINAAGVIYNHCIALHRRYYRMFKKHLNCAKLQAHIAKLRKRNPFWQSVGSQAVQDICQRIEQAYQLFFKHHKRGVKPPGFKKVKKYKSFTLKQAGYKFLGGNRVKIGNRVYQYWNSREIEGTLKTLTIKRTPLGELIMVVVVDQDSEPFIDPWFSSSKTCSNCGHILEELDLNTRQWRCPSCSLLNDRDENAATNIKIVGASTIGLDTVRRASPASVA